ncbi:hypothetical protein SAMN05216227_102059 [Pseudorhodobacter antarcticus]|uniref:Poly A polymerase head domain-containing protein n=1 Tax=Pseudorhodobacter antarcticus TaxID=1077947 RepID=A0A1H8IHW4_9RHOB|nr:hypothetical protein [Pseudorhodobacter antarcticus]SEN68470.1 hypothetical protein SAMN05216227_102059 [Pseudorhodobacter antarcticus]
MSKILELIAFMEEVDDAIYEHYKHHPFRMSYVIAGGALRDTLLGQPVKDIDVVVENAAGWGVPWPDTTSYGPTGGFIATEGAFTVRGLPLNLIYRGGDISIQSMMEYHSMAVSNVFWARGALTIDKRFLRDAADKQHTVNRERWGGVGGGVGNSVDEQMLQKYIDKITAKYPWPLR